MLYAKMHISTRRADLQSQGAINGVHSHISHLAADVGLLAFAIHDTRHVSRIRWFMSMRATDVNAFRMGNNRGSDRGSDIECKLA